MQQSFGTIALVGRNLSFDLNFLSSGVTGHEFLLKTSDLHSTQTEDVHWQSYSPLLSLSNVRKTAINNNSLRLHSTSQFAKHVALKDTVWASKRNVCQCSRKSLNFGVRRTQV